MLTASYYKMIIDLACIDRQARINLELGTPWHDGVDVTHLCINQETVQELKRLGFEVQQTNNCTFVKWR